MYHLVNTHKMFQVHLNKEQNCKWLSSCLVQKNNGVYSSHKQPSQKSKETLKWSGLCTCMLHFPHSHPPRKKHRGREIL